MLVFTVQQNEATACSVTQSCLTLCDPMNFSPPGSSVEAAIHTHGQQPFPSCSGGPAPVTFHRVMQVGWAHHRHVPSVPAEPSASLPSSPDPYSFCSRQESFPCRANFVSVSTLALSIRNTSILYFSHKLTYISSFSPYLHSLLFHLFTAVFH